ncbi:MAG: DUF6438 domain-containing protein [Lutisporaceae bacterium]
MFEYIKLERTMCYGDCPVYEVTVDSKGNVEYIGDTFVYKIGQLNSKISNRKVKQLADKLYEFNYKSFVYEPGDLFATDHPSCITTVKYLNGEIKTVDHYLGHFLVDKKLSEFENSIDRILGTKKYVSPKLYIYMIEVYDTINIEHMLSKYIVITVSEEKALELIATECSNTESTSTKIQKIGTATDGYKETGILMR